MADGARQLQALFTEVVESTASGLTADARQELGDRYRTGALKVNVLGLQCVGFNNGLNGVLRNIHVNGKKKPTSSVPAKRTRRQAKLDED